MLNKNLHFRSRNIQTARLLKGGNSLLSPSLRVASLVTLSSLPKLRGLICGFTVVSRSHFCVLLLSQGLLMIILIDFLVLIVNNGDTSSIGQVENTENLYL